MTDARKCLVIGLDGGTFDVVRPLVESGRLPHLAALMREGAWGELRSTSPPVTPPAWTSFMTGKNPGKHGIFDFYAPPSRGYDRPVLNARANRARTLWRILSDHGKAVGVLNVPLTHPPEKVRGFIVPGMQYSLDSHDGFTHPPELFAELTARFGDYRVVFGDERSLYTDDLDDFLAQWREIHRIRRQAALHLMTTRPWDFFMVVFYSIDAVQHHCWKAHDPAHPLHTPALKARYGDVIAEFYGRVDEAIGELLRHAGAGTAVFVVSDHGFGPEHTAFFLNRWLMQEGLLRVKPRYAPLLRVRLPHRAYRLLQRLGSPAVAWTLPPALYPLLAGRVDPREGLNVSRLIDWTRTAAFAGNHTEQGIYLNVKGREPHGIVEPGEEYERLRARIAGRLAALTDPDTGRPAVDVVYRPEQVYAGPHLGGAPDLFVAMGGGACIAQKELHPRRLFRPADKSSGTHRMNGIFIARAAGVKRGAELQGLSILDVAPTILHAMDVPVPEDMDGRVLTELYEAPLARAVRYSAPAPGAGTDGDGTYGEAEGGKIREALRGLGYL